MNKNYIYIKVLMVLLIAGSMACSDDFLNLSPHQSVSNEDALETIGDYESSITAAYNGLSDADYYGRYFVLVPDVMSDDVKQHPSANRAKDYAEFTAVVGDGIAEEMWQEMWQEINNLNAIINTPIEVTASLEDDRDHIVGEAYALRGLVYFDMVRIYAQHYTFTNDASHLGVPIVLEFDQFGEPERNTVAEVYAQVISDMLAGIALMSDTPRSGDTSTLSATAARALLSRVYLYMEDWTNAEALATQVISSGKYTLVPNANYESAWVGDFSSESIFEIDMTEIDNRGSDALGGMYLVTGYGDYLPSADYTTLLPGTDIRADIWLSEDTVLTGDHAPFRLSKYPSITGENNTKVMRLSEVHLIRAEANAQIGGATAELAAQADLDLIRQRAQPDAAPILATGQALINEALLERRKELAFEGHRTWDLMRYKQDIVRTNCTSVPTACTITYPSERVILPIPEAELDANPNIQPNPGY